MDLDKYREASLAVVFKKYKEAIRVSSFRGWLFKLCFLKGFSEILNSSKEIDWKTTIGVLIQRGECYFREKMYGGKFLLVFFLFLFSFFP